MDNQLDLSKVISIITENPDLIARISALAAQSGRSEDQQSEKETEESTSKTEETDIEEVSAVPKVPTVKNDRNQNRQRLLSAFKPYLSTDRAKAIDSMLTIAEVLDAVRRVIERTPPELVGDLMKNGIVMTGGGSLIPGFEKMVADVTGIKTRVARDPVACVVRGTGVALEDVDGRPTGMLNLSEERKKRL
jgi:actin-like ATPase involved in cell morphogenesis